MARSHITVSYDEAMAICLLLAEAADASADAAALSEAVAGLAVISINPSPDYAGTVLRITYPSHLSPAPHLIRLPIGV